MIANLLGQLAFGLIAMTVCIPSMQEWSALLDTTQAQVQLTFSGYVFAYGGFQLVHGPLSDRVGRKPVLLGGLVVAIAGSALALVLPLTLMGAGHGLLMPPTLSGAVGVLPALAGAAAAIAGLLQQLAGALGGYAVGLVTHRDGVNLAWMMLALGVCGALSMLGLPRRGRPGSST